MLIDKRDGRASSLSSRRSHPHLVPLPLSLIIWSRNRIMWKFAGIAIRRGSWRESARLALHPPLPLTLVLIPFFATPSFPVVRSLVLADPFSLPFCSLFLSFPTPRFLPISRRPLVPVIVFRTFLASSFSDRERCGLLPPQCNAAPRHAPPFHVGVITPGITILV